MTHHSSFRTHHSRKAYPVYKPSGMDWVGDIPEHWEVQRLKHITKVQFSSVDKHTIDDEEPVRLCNYVDVYYNDFIREGIDFMAATATRSEIARFQLRHGDVLITKDSEAWDDIAVPAYVADELDGVLCGYHLAHIRPDLRKVLGEYLFRAFRSRGVNDQFRVAANGITRFGLGKYWLDNGLFPVPPLAEQKAIAAFLDRETARIDALIAKKRRQIGLLQEKRSALISHAVTKGLSGMRNDECGMMNSPAADDSHHSSFSTQHFKDSGIEWLGQIPKHWEAKRLKHAIHIRGGQVDPRLEQYSRMILIAPNHIESGTGRVLNLDSAEEQGAISGKYLFRRGDVLYSKIRPELAKACIAPEDGLCSADMYAMVPRRGVVSTFILYLLLSDAYTKLAVDESMRVAMPKINREDLGEIRWPFPPAAEQAEIVVDIETVIATIDALLVRIQDSISTLQEHRTALISAAVTGKIDVRGEVA